MKIRIFYILINLFISMIFSREDIWISNIEFDKTGTINSLRNFMVSNSIKLKAQNFIEENIQKSKTIIDSMEGNVQFLKYYSV